jgi:restriction system protein
MQTVKRGIYKITPGGQDIIKKNLDRIDLKFIEKFPKYQEFLKNSHQAVSDKVEKKDEHPTSSTPEETFEYAYQKLRKELANELLSTIKSCSPEFFEKLVVDLLISMGYGGSRKDAGEAIGKTNDEGIDGIIKEDRLGLDTIYIQAKRWEGCVGRPEIQKFAGALQGQRAKKGIFITTGYFSEEAKNFAKNIESKIILIDGNNLSEYMIDFNVGVSRVSSYEIKRIDSDYFVEG